MVAGMLMPLEQLHAIYELLFRDGVMVAQKDRRPHSYHPQLPGVTHLQVQRALGSLRARGLVRETFAWRHSYWYLTDEGIAHLRQCLRLPPEIVPTTLQRVRHPVATARPASRPPRVQTVPGPLSCPPQAAGALAAGVSPEGGVCQPCRARGSSCHEDSATGGIGCRSCDSRRSAASWTATWSPQEWTSVRERSGRGGAGGAGGRGANQAKGSHTPHWAALSTELVCAVASGPLSRSDSGSSGPSRVPLKLECVSPA
ncbi:hypothetical protein lerEdw1_014462 [Lerista edwardsae]|nr:hypothetical protein lerEdw1_014462 [Lerista edwardsae]